PCEELSIAGSFSSISGTTKLAAVASALAAPSFSATCSVGEDRSSCALFNASWTLLMTSFREKFQSAAGAGPLASSTKTYLEVNLLLVHSAPCRHSGEPR